MIAKTVGLYLLKMIAYGAVCYLFARYIEKPLTGSKSGFAAPAASMVLVAGLGLIIAAVAELLGFSLAIGAFFAGLVFSRDPETVKNEASFMPLYELFSPFFFISIGLSIDPGSLSTALGVGAVLSAAAILSKIAANGLPVLFMGGLSSAILIGVSMVPRAEITMVIIKQSLDFGAWAMPPDVYGAMVMVSAVTCLITPFAVRYLLKRYPPTPEDA